MPAPGDRGFVLIAAVWLLLLAGAVVAALSLRQLSLTRSSAKGAAGLSNQMRTESAAQTVLFDRAAGGARSFWFALPVRGAVSVGGAAVEAEVSSESHRFNLNATDPAAYEETSRTVALSPDARRALDALVQLHRRHQRIHSWPELEWRLFEAGLPGARAELGPRVTLVGFGTAGNLMNASESPSARSSFDMLGGVSSLGRQRDPFRIEIRDERSRTSPRIFVHGSQDDPWVLLSE